MGFGLSPLPKTAKRHQSALSLWWHLESSLVWLTLVWLIRRVLAGKYSSQLSENLSIKKPLKKSFKECLKRQNYYLVGLIDQPRQGA
jgi:hypothetical protein